MPSILNLKFKGNKSFVAFSNLNDTEALTKTWKVCTKVASYLEQGQRLENLSWRLWHLQNLIVDTDNAKSKREFRKLSKCMGDKLDKEKGRSIEELEAPDFKANHSIDIIRQRAEEKERNREASQNAAPGTIKRMQFTFSVDQPSIPAVNQPVKKPSLKPSAEFNTRSWNAARANQQEYDDRMVISDDEGNDKDPPNAQRISNGNTKQVVSPTSLRFPPIFSNDFGPSALLYPTPTLTTSMNYGEGLDSSSSHEHFSISRPTIELPLDELLKHVESSNDSHDVWDLPYFISHSSNNQKEPELQQQQQPSFSSTETILPEPPQTAIITTTTTKAASPIIAPDSDDDDESSNNDSDDEDSDFDLNAPARPNPATKIVTTRRRASTTAGASKNNATSITSTTSTTSSSSKIINNQLYESARSNTPVGRPTLTVKTQTSRTSGPGATATGNSAVLRSTNNHHHHTLSGGGGTIGAGGGSGGNSAPGGVKAECSNCGATHTPLWRRGLNDELNCNACGLYCKLHKRPRPKSMRSTHGEGRTQAPPRQETVDVMGSSSPVTTKVPPRSSSPVHRIAQCYNCHTTATPLWRKDDEGKTVCNACGLYYKLHGSARPISMKSDIIRKRSRHDARRGSGGGGGGGGGGSGGGGNSVSDTPSASPGVSRRTSPVRDLSPTLAPDSTTQLYDFSDELDFHSTESELLGALGHLSNQQIFQSFSSGGVSSSQFPGPYHPDYLPQNFTMPSDPLPFPPSDSSDLDENGMSPRVNKRRRMSTDSASEPPSSATSYSSYNDGYSTPASSANSHSHRGSMDFPFSSYLGGSSFNGPALRGSGNTFWHPPMMPQGEEASNNSPGVNIHPPMLPPDESMDYLQQPLQHGDEELFSSFLHPPMAIPCDDNASGGQMGNNAHPPMMTDYSNESFDSTMRVY